jgi:hypothetical protein
LLQDALGVGVAAFHAGVAFDLQSREPRVHHRSSTLLTA